MAKTDVRVELVGQNGNIFNLMGITRRELKRAGYKEEAKEMCEKIMSEAKSYDDALIILMEYVEVD